MDKLIIVSLFVVLIAGRYRRHSHHEQPNDREILTWLGDEHWKEGSMMSTRHEQIVATLERLAVSIGADMIGAVAVSIDGLVLASKMSSDINAERVGAVAATIIGVARRVSNELKIGLAEEIILKSQQGMFVVLPAGDQGLVAVNVRHSSNLGMVRLEARDAAILIGHVL